MSQTLRVTLIKLRLLESVTKYSRAMITLTFGQLIKSIPNPRFINKKQASFYRFRLELTNSLTERAFIKVYGLGTTDHQIQEIVVQEIVIGKIQNNKVCTINNGKIMLEYEIAVMKDYLPPPEQQENSRTQINLETQKLSEDLPVFESVVMRRSTPEMVRRHQGIETRNNRQLDQLSDSAEKSPLLSERQYLQAHETLTMYRQNYAKSPEEFGIENISDYNFLQPITHTPPATPRVHKKQSSSNNTSPQFPSKQPSPSPKPKPKLQSKPRQKPVPIQDDNQMSIQNVIVFFVISIVSFVFGILVKQGGLH